MGNVNMTPEEFEAMLDRAAKKGARAALEELGLHDQNAEKDLEEIRNLLTSWRDTKKAIWSTVVKVVTSRCSDVHRRGSWFLRQEQHWELKHEPC
jgi:hypothetical protein